MRILIALGGGLIVALLLFWFDLFLISGRDTHKEDMEPVSVVNFIRVHEDEFTQFKKRQKPKEPEPPKKPPPPPKLSVQDTSKPPPVPMNIDMPKIDVPVATGGGPYLGNWQENMSAAEGDVIPIVRIDPQWPREALLNGIEGWVKVEFTILADGTVTDPVVLEAEPRRMFDRNALRAILKWKFKPRIIDGKPVERRATQTIEFSLDQS